MDLGLVADQTRVTHLRVQLMITSLKILREDSYRQAVEEVHQNDHDQEHKGEEEDIAEGRVEGDVRELKLSNEHGEGLDQTEAQVVVGRCRPIRKWSHYTARVDEEDEENRYIWISGHTMGDQMVEKSIRVFYSG